LLVIDVPTVPKVAPQPRPGLCLDRISMKSVTDDEKSDTDFYRTNVAPLNEQHEQSFRYLDMVLLTVLFLEIGGLIRLLLAK
jgi:hypothetical protein